MAEEADGGWVKYEAQAADIERMVKALGKLYRMGARGVKEWPENFPIAKVKEIAAEALGDRLEEQKRSAFTVEGCASQIEGGGSGRPYD